LAEVVETIVQSSLFHENRITTPIAATINATARLHLMHVFRG